MPEYLSNEIQSALIEGYCRAARAGAEMRAVTASLENIRDALAKQPTFPAAMAAFSEEIGRAEPKFLLGILTVLSREFQRVAGAQMVASLKSDFARDATFGWNRWLKEYVQSFDERGWQTCYALLIAEGALSFSPLADWPVDRIRESVRCILQSRWPEAYDWIAFLAEQDFAPTQRANFLVACAEIHLYHFMQPTKARALLEQARSLVANDSRVIYGWGEYFVQQDKTDHAREYFEQLTHEWPQLIGGWMALGDCSEKAGDLDAAQDQFEQAIVNFPWSTSPYRRLISLLCRRRDFQRHQPKVVLLFTRLLALDEEPVGVRVDLGANYKQNGMPDEARKQFLQAIVENPAYVNAYSWLGYTDIDQNLPCAARVNFEKVIQMAPRALDGYWGMSVLSERAEQWQDAIDLSDRALQCHPEWESHGRARRGELLRKMGKLEDAEKELLRSLVIETGNPSALDSLSSLANDFLSRDDAAAVERTLQTLRRLKGDSYESIYQNRLGNLRYWFNDYAAAAEHYRKAIAANPKDDVLQSNLALSLEVLRQPGNRVAELEEASTALRRARELDLNNEEYSLRLEALELESRFIAAYGEDALKYSPSVTPVRIELPGAALDDILVSPGGGTLSQETYAKLNSMRSRVRNRYGVTVPGVLFSELQELLYEGNYRIILLERSYAHGTINPGQKFVPLKTREDSIFPPDGTWAADVTQSPGEDEVWDTADYVLFHLRTILETHLAEFFGHDEAALALKNCKSDSAAAIRSSDKDFTAFVQILRARLAKQIPILELDSLCEEFRKSHAAGADVSGTTPRSLNEISRDASRISEKANNLQSGD